MAQSTCIKCGGKVFQVQTKEPMGSNYKLNFVQCAGCGGVVGVLEYYSVGVKVDKVEKMVKDLDRDVSEVQRLVRSLR